MTHLHLSRIDYTPEATISVFCVEGALWGYALEDRRRPEGVKIPGRTCIPAGSYRLRVTFSARFKRWMPQIMDVPGFSGVRLHGGNTPADTEGCPLIAANRPERARVQGSLEARLLQYLAVRIPRLAGESEESFWARLPDTRITLQDGPLGSAYAS
jgi:hypothetical protein